MRCLVTGGAGFIGSHLVESLLATGHEVVVLDDFSSGKRENLPAASKSLSIHTGTILDSSLLCEATKNIDWVFHLAGLASVQASLENPLASHAVNATGTLQVFAASKAAGVKRVVYAASSSAYGNVDHPVQKESDPWQPLSPYAAAKLAGELYAHAFVQSFGLPCIRLRFFNVFGPRQDPSSPYSGVIARFAQFMKQGQRPTIFGDGLQSRDFVYVSDVCQALIAAARSSIDLRQAKREWVYNIGTGRATNLLELIQALNDILGTNMEPLFAPARAGDVRHSCADISLAQAELGYKPIVSLREGLRQTVAV